MGAADSGFTEVEGNVEAGRPRLPAVRGVCHSDLQSQGEFQDHFTPSPGQPLGSCDNLKVFPKLNQYLSPGTRHTAPWS